MKKLIITISVLVLVLITALAFMTYSYSKTDEYAEQKLPEKTTINGIDCSNLTYDGAQDKLTKEWNRKNLVVTGELKETLGKYTDFGCTYKIEDKIKELKKKYMLPAAANHYLSTPFSVNVDMIIDECGSDFKQRVLSSDFINKPDATESKDAYVDINDSEYPIISEVLGTEIDKKKFFDAVTHQIETGKFNLKFNDDDFHVIPKVTAEDPTLTEYQEFCKKYMKQKISYQMGEESFTITPQELSTLFNSDMSGKADEAAVKAYVDQLASRYNNVGAERKFKSISGKDITVKGGTYGWTIDREKEAAQLISDINSHKNVERKPVYSFESYGDYTRTMGSTYVDIDISKQQVKYYKDGIEKYSCNVVTGNRANGTITPTGTYYILNKVRNVTMRGNNVDGSSYEAKAAYWLGVTWQGVGMHDSPRSQFGGSIWKTNGSHGCINMPKNRIPELFNMVEPGIPVVMHY